MEYISSAYKAVATRLTPMGRVAYFPYALFRVFLQWAHYATLNASATLSLRINALTAMLLMQEVDKKAIDQSIESAFLANKQRAMNLERPVVPQIMYIFEPVDSLLDLTRIFSVTWLRTDYYYDRYVVHTPFCAIGRLFRVRSHYVYAPSWAPAASQEVSAAETNFEDVDFQPRSYKLQSSTVRVSQDGHQVSGSLRLLSPKKESAFSAACPYISTQEPVIAPHVTPPATVSAATVSPQITSNRKRLKIKFRRTSSVPEVVGSGDYDSVRGAIKEILNQPGYDDGSIAPNLVRFGWHCSATYDRRDGTGGSNGATMRFPPELTDPGNTGLHTAKAYLEEIKHKFPWITYADLYTLGSVVAIEAMKGPIIPWKPGRTDCVDSAKVPQNGRLPVATEGVAHIREVFQTRLGFNDQETVALIGGGHTLGRTHAKFSGFNGKWTDNPVVFDNEMFAVLLNENWELTQVPETGRHQFTNQDKTLMMLNTDMELLKDEMFLQWVKVYAQDQERFFADFASAFGKLLELGVIRDEDGIARYKV